MFVGHLAQSAWDPLPALPMNSRCRDVPILHAGSGIQYSPISMILT